MASTDNTSKELEIFKERLKEICDMAEVVNLGYHGRPDCKSCSLLETIQEKLL